MKNIANPRQVSCKTEWDKPMFILTHRPGFESLCGAYFPAGGLCQGPFSLEIAQQEHDELIKILKAELPDARIERVTDVLEQEAKNSGVREKLRQIASQSLDIMANSGDEQCDLLRLSKEYALEFLSPKELVTTCLIRPEIIARKIGYNTGYEQSTAVRPMNNFIFTRDQQIITDRGLVMGYMNSSQRFPETLLMRLVFEILGVEPIMEVEGKGRLEGGDFIPAGDIAFQGRGLRTNSEGIGQVLSRNGYGYDEVAVVIDPLHKQDEMHLDTYFNMPSRNKCVVLKDHIERGNPKESMVEVYSRNENGYVCTTRVSLREYLASRGIDIIPISKEEQLAYAPNFLTIAPDRVIGIDITAKEEIKKQLKRVEDKYGSQDFFHIRDEQGREIDYIRLGNEFVDRMNKAGITFIPVNFNHMNMMYGGIHCGTQVIRGTNQ